MASGITPGGVARHRPPCGSGGGSNRSVRAVAIAHALQHALRELESATAGGDELTIHRVLSELIPTYVPSPYGGRLAHADEAR